MYSPSLNKYIRKMDEDLKSINTRDVIKSPTR